MTDDKNVLGPEAAQAIIEQDRRARAEACGRALQEVLARHRCELMALPQIAPDGRIVAVVNVAAR